MQKIQNASPLGVETPPAGMLDRVLPFVAIAGLAALALGFWAANGPSVFGEMITAAWALCF